MRNIAFFGFDILLLSATLLLIIIGVLFIYSSGVTATGDSFSDEYIKQIVWIVSGFIILTLILLMNYNLLMHISIYIYGFCLLLLIFTLFFGKVVNGARSWIGFRDFGIQPSEFAKIATILVLGTYYINIKKNITKLRFFMLGFLIILLPLILIILQPDLGTALVYIPIFLIMSLIAGARIRHIIFILLLGIIMIVLVILPHIEKFILGEEYPVLALVGKYNVILFFIIFLISILGISIWGYFAFKKKVFYWISFVISIIIIAALGSIVLSTLIKEYQIKRIITFLNPYIDRRDSGWNLIQSITAIGSGGFFGKGFLMGTQSHYQYLPQQSTDFIFSIIAEEWGFIGGGIVIILFMIILLRGTTIVSSANDRYALYIGSGIIGMIFFHVIINIGMTMGIMPITGIPLFFLSYGGSSLWTGLIGIGILLNISFRRYKYK